jgi:hypothetical protein
MQAARFGFEVLLVGTCSHLQITVPSSMPKAVMIAGERSN